MESIFYTDPSQVKIKLINNYNYDFLNNNRFTPTPLYDIINSYDTYKLKNIYYNIYIRIFKINKQYPGINPLKKNDQYIDQYTFNKMIKEYVQDNDILKIIVANSILTYYH